MSKPLKPMTLEDRVSMLEAELAGLKLLVEQLASPKGSRVGQLGGSAVHLPQEVWEEYQRCCEEARRQLDSATDYRA